jgi:hypothetical protein
VRVKCSFKGNWEYSLGGKVSGLAANQILVLKNAVTAPGGNTTAATKVEHQTLVVQTDGTFSFPEPVDTAGGKYDVVVARAPEQQICGVQGGEGSIPKQADGAGGDEAPAIQIVCRSKMVTQVKKLIEKQKSAGGHEPYAYSEIPGEGTSTEWFSEGCKCMRCDGSSANSHALPFTVCSGRSSGCVQVQ